MRLTCTKRYHEIPFAHRAPFHDGHCSKVHGHGWSFEFEFAADQVDGNGFIVDFGKLKSLKAALDQLDHGIALSAQDPELFYFRSRPDLFNVLVVPDASSEGLAMYFFRIADALVRGGSRGERCVRCTVFEDSRNSATYAEA